MSYAKEEKVITFSLNAPQVRTSNCLNYRLEKKLNTALLKISLDERKKEAMKPLYIKRI